VQREESWKPVSASYSFRHAEEWECGDDCLALICVSVNGVHELNCDVYVL
jgi:hypothetical protein